jgi:hypothetical protein
VSNAGAVGDRMKRATKWSTKSIFYIKKFQRTKTFKLLTQIQENSPPPPISIRDDNCDSWPRAAHKLASLLRLSCY